MNYYEILQVSPAASLEVIQMAYRALQNQYQIEALQGDKKYAELKIQQLDEAYRVLSSPILRQQYDNLLQMRNAQTSMDPQTPQQQSQNSLCEKKVAPKKKRILPVVLAIVLVVAAAAGVLLYKNLTDAPAEEMSSPVSVVSLEEYREIVANYGLPVYIYPEEMQKMGNAEVYATNFGGSYSQWPDQECMMVYYAISPDHDTALHEENLQLSVQEDAVAKWGILDSAEWSTKNGSNYACTEVDDMEEGYRYLVNCVVDNVTIRIVASRTYKEDAQKLFEQLVSGLGNDQAETAPEEQVGNTFVKNWLKNPETGEEIHKNQVQSVTFLGTLADAPENSWDVSSLQDGSVLVWAIPNGKVYDIYMAAEGGVNAGDSCNDLFNGFRKLQRVSFNDAFDTENVKQMSRMFKYCSSLRDIDLTELDTSNVMDMSEMFSGCLRLLELDLAGLQTANVTSMSAMFYDCENLRKLDLSGLDTSNVTTMTSMFSHCFKLEEINFVGFETGKVRSMYAMFSMCDSLTELDLSSFDTSNVTDMSAMFGSCGKLATVNFDQWDTGNVTNMVGMFGGCSSLTTLDLSSFDTSHVTDMSQMFLGCEMLKTIDLSSFETSNVTDMSSMFSFCSALTQLDLSGFDTSNVINMNSMFSNCTSLTSLNIENFNTSNVTDMSGMFSQVFNLKKLKLGEFDTSKVVFEKFEEGFASTDYIGGIYWRDLFKN